MEEKGWHRSWGGTKALFKLPPTTILCMPCDIMILSTVSLRMHDTPVSLKLWLSVCRCERGTTMGCCTAYTVVYTYYMRTVGGSWNKVFVLYGGSWNKVFAQNIDFHFHLFTVQYSVHVISLPCCTIESFTTASCALFCTVFTHVYSTCGTTWGGRPI
jgi:hypothetical protein